MRIATAGAAIVVSATVCGAQSADVESVANRFYPQKFIDDAIRLKEPLNRIICASAYSVAPGGAPQVIVAGYSDGFQGTVKVLGRQGAGNYRVLYEPAGLDLDGAPCSVEFIDVDGDGVQEIHVAFGSASGNDGDWLFKWDGRTLRSIGATAQRDGETYTKLVNIAFEDLYHDGTLAVVSAGGDSLAEDGLAAEAPEYVYRLVNGHYVLAAPVLLVDTFTSQEPRRLPTDGQFYLPKGSTGPYTLRVVNGDRAGAGRVSSGQIRLNGKEIVSPDRFKTPAGILSVPLSPLRSGDNQLSVELPHDRPGGHITVVVEDHTPRFLTR